MRYYEYKTCDIPWLPLIPKHWNCVKLKAYCKENKERNKGNVEKCVLSLSYGRVVVKQDLNFGLVPENYENYQIVNPGYIILRLTDLQNDHKSLRTGLAKNRGIITSAYVGLVINGINSEYAQLLLHSYDIMKVFYGMGDGLRQSIGFQDISNLFIPIPPSFEQQAIVTYLEDKCAKIDRLVENKTKELELLQEMKQRMIADAVTRGLNPDVKMKESGIAWLPMVPEHWNVVKLKAFCKENKEKNKGNVESCVLSLSYGRIIVKQDINFGLVPDNYENYQIVQPGYIILRLTDLQNDHKSLRTGYVKNKGIITSAYVGLIVNVIDSEYTQLLLHSYDIMKVFYGMGGGLRQSMNYQDIAKLYIPIPPKYEQKNIVNHVHERIEKIDTLAAKLQKEIENIKEYKQRLISDVVTGQIKVC